MGGKTVVIVPATVPSAKVLRRQRAEAEQPTVSSAVPGVVPRAQATPVIPDQITAEQAAQLRRENASLREELERVRAS